MALPALLFDLDDTLVAFEAVSDLSWAQVCTQVTLPVDPRLLVERIRDQSRIYWSDAERHRWGRFHMLEARREIVAAAFRSLGLGAEEGAGLADSFSRVRLENMYLLDGAREVLDRFRDSGHVMALVTNGDGPGQRDKVKRFELQRFFDTVLIEGEVGFGKPDCRIYRRALEELGVRAEDAHMVGDNLTWDVEAPQALGIRSVWIDRAGAGVPAGRATEPWRTIRAIAEFPEALGL